MKSTAEKLSPTRVKLTVEVPMAEMQPAYDAAAKKIAGQVQIPGFRKGKVPVQLIEQRFGREAIMQDALNDALPGFYEQAAREAEIAPLGRPEVDVTKVPGITSPDAPLEFVVEQDVRPDIELPDFSSLEVEIEEGDVDDDAVQVRLDQLRERFGTLTGVDRPAEDGDFVSLDMVAKIEDEEIETVEGVSYRIGDGTMLDGLDEALLGLSAGESTTFSSKLAGGERAGEDADITITAQSVKERQLPEADDEFAQLASEFDTIDELTEDLRNQAAKDAENNRTTLARNALLEKLLEDIEIPVPQGLVDQEIENHLSNENKPADDPHGEEIREDTEKAIRAQILLDSIQSERKVNLEQNDVMSYMQSLAAQYGVEANQLVQMLAQSNQLEAVFAEAMRSKALDAVLAEVTVKNQSGEVLELGLEAGSEEIPDWNAEIGGSEESDESEGSEGDGSEDNAEAEKTDGSEADAEAEEVAADETAADADEDAEAKGD